MAHRLALFLAAGASVTAHGQDATTCSARGGTCAGVAPMLLQTHRATDKVAEASAGANVPPLPPAFVAPEGAETYAKAAKTMAEAFALPPGAEDLSLLAAAIPSTYSSNDWNVYLQTKALRQQGFTCPGGQYFAPNSGEFLFDCRLWRAALLHSQDMGQRNYFDHVDPDGKDPFDRSKAQGFGTFNENIAAGVSDATGTMEQWKKSDGHCTNMMKASHTRMGAGYASVSGSTYNYYWTQLFGSGNGAADTSCYDGSGGGGSTPSPSPSPSPSGGGSSGCSDASSNCGSWASAGYCSSSSQYYGYMLGNCKAACGFCGGGGGFTPSPSPSPSGGGGSGCSDANTNCASWKSAGYCSSSSQYYGYMQGNCRASCGFCGGASTGGGGSSSCADASSSCGSWASSGYCSSSSQYYSYMRQNCPRSCSMCR